MELLKGVKMMMDKIVNHQKNKNLYKDELIQVRRSLIIKEPLTLNQSKLDSVEPQVLKGK